MWFKNLLLKLLGVSRRVVEFLLPILVRQSTSLLEEALPIALEIVKSYEFGTLDGDTKRAAAVDRLRATLAARGVATQEELRTSLLNWIVETALQRLRAENG